MQLNYEDVMNNLIIEHSETINDYVDGLRFLIDSQCDGISYKKYRQFSLLNVAVLEKDGNGNYFYEFNLDRDGDIYDNFKFESNNNITISYIINSNIYNTLNEFLVVASQYSDIKIRVTFLNKPNSNDEFRLSYRVYLLESNSRHYLIKNSIKTNTNLYNNGVCHKLL